MYTVGGVEVHKSIDSGGSWALVGSQSTGIPDAVWVVAVSPADSSIVFAGTPTGVYVSRDAGASWRISMKGMPLPSSIMHIVADPALPSHVFVGTSRGVYVSYDNGQQWYKGTAGLSSEGLLYTHALVLDPTSPPTLYAIFANHSVYQSINQAASWAPTTQPPGTSSQGVNRLAVGRGAPSALFAVGSSMARSDDGGRTWVTVGTGLPGQGATVALDTRRVLVGTDPAPDGLVVGIDLDAGAIVHATPLGGTGHDDLRTIAIGDTSDLIVAGSSQSAGLPSVNAMQPLHGGGPDVLVARISPDLDTDADGMTDAWERQVGLAVGVDDAGADADGDGATNVEEARRGTHPRGFHTAYLAEGATGSFFQTLLAVVNPDPAETAHTWIRFLDATGRETGMPLLVPPLGRRTVDVAAMAGLAAAEFGTTVESDVGVAVSRTMQWDANGYGAHAGQAVAPSARWLFAEGATTAGFQLFYLLANPHDVDAHVQVTWLLADGRAPLEESHTVSAHSRLTIWVNHVPGLSSAELGAAFVTDTATPIVVERAMYLDAAGQVFGAGHAGAGIAEPAAEWFVAEGATGSYLQICSCC